MDQQILTINPYKVGDKVLIIGDRTRDSKKLLGKSVTVSRSGDNGPGSEGWIFIEEIDQTIASGIWITDIKMDIKEWD